MELSKNSFNAKFYKLFYSRELPNNLCNYFWGLVLAYMFALPLLVMGAPGFVLFKLLKDPIESFTKMAVIGVLLYVSLTIILSMLSPIYLIFKEVDLNEDTFIVDFIEFGIGLDLMLVSGLVTFLLIQLVSKLVGKDKKPNLIQAFIKAKIGKYCPKIDWR